MSCLGWLGIGLGLVMHGPAWSGHGFDSVAYGFDSVAYGLALVASIKNKVLLCILF